MGAFGYIITKHDIKGTLITTRLNSTNNPVYFEHEWTESEKLQESDTMEWMIAQLQLLDMNYIAPVETVSDIPYAESIPVNMADVSALVVSSTYPEWIPIYHYIIGDKVTYKAVYYEVVQDHISQTTWPPDTTPALYKISYLPGTIPEWVQPTGAQDAYYIGDNVMFEGHQYESLIDANVWSPTAYPAGWQLIA